MLTPIIRLLLGHLIGDYMLQTSWMAMNKGKKTCEGWFAAILHSIVYTASICTTMWNFNYWWIIAVFLSHVFIDHYSTATWYLKHVKGMNKPYKYSSQTYTSLYWIIYVVVDNTMHLLLMLGAYHLIFNIL